MKRTVYSSLVAIALACGVAIPALAQTDAVTKQQKLEKLKQLREDARKAGKANPPPTTTPTTPPPPPPPPPTTPPPPPPTASARVSPSATPAASASSTPPKPATSSSATPAASSSAAPAASNSAAPPSSAAALPAELEQLRRTRPDRRRADVQRLKDRWGELVSDGRAKTELEKHARRLAYLQRIRSLAEKSNDAKFVENVDKLLTKEERRNADAMNAIRTGAPAPSAGAK